MGSVDGPITESARGERGFGYDPYFFSSELRKTLAEATVAEKQEVSHRGAAFRALLRELGPGD